MANKIPHVMIATGIGLTALGVVLFLYQRKKEKAEEEAAKTEEQDAAAHQPQPKIPLTVFADEGVPREAVRP